MGLEDYLLDKQDVQKYALFKRLKSIDYETTTVKDLSRQLDMPYSATYTAFNRVVEDIRVLDADYEPQNLAEKRLSATNIKVTVNEYRLFLLKNSLAFQFFDELFLNPGSGMSTFLQTHFISEATLVRRIQRFRNFLTRYDITVSLKKFELIGDEMKIRQLLFTYYAMSYHDFIPESPAVTYKRTKALYAELSESYGWLNTQSDGIRWLAVSLLRMSQKHYVGENLRTEFFFNENHLFNVGVFNQKNFPGIANEVLLNEAKFYYVMQYFFGEYKVSSEEFNSQFYDFMESEENYIWQFKELLLSHMQTINFAGTQEIKHNAEIQLDLVKLLSMYYLQGGNFAKRSDFIVDENNHFTESSLYQEISSFCETNGSVSEYLTFINQQEDLSMALTVLLAPYYKAIETEQLLNVAVVVDESNYLSGTLVNLLEDLSFVKVLPSESETKPDVIVSDLAVSGLLSQLMNGGKSTAKATDEPAVINWQQSADIMSFHAVSTKLRNIYDEKEHVKKVS